MASGAMAASGYTHKLSPYSSHTLLLESLPPEGKGKRVLDVGCASGYLAEILAQRGFEVVGLERPGGYGSNFPESVELVEVDLDSGVPPLRGRFSYVICGDILEHLRNPERMLNQLAKVLEPDGMLIASLPNSGNLYFRLMILGGEFPQKDRGLFDRTHVHFYMWKGWRELFESAGFELRQTKVTGVPVGLAFPEWDGSAIMRALEWLVYSLARLRPPLFAYQFVVTARRRDL
jgi:2-polyprenyl-3-methyl-5-hydroxy-6-metoxy-1,4-benzoquinol methylase